MAGGEAAAEQAEQQAHHVPDLEDATQGVERQGGAEGEWVRWQEAFRDTGGSLEEWETGWGVEVCGSVREAV